MATAKKLPSGSWRCRVYSHTDENGKKVYKSFTCDDPSPKGKRKCEAMATEWAVEKENRERADYTVDEAIDGYIKSKDKILSPSTLRGYYTLKNNAYDKIKSMKIDRITQRDIQSWANEYSTNHSPKTVKNAHGLLSATLLYYAPNLRINTKLPEKQPVQRYTPSDNDIKQLLKSIQGTDLERAVLLAAFGTLRRGEICALTSDDITGDCVMVNKNYIQGVTGMVIKSPKTPTGTRIIEYPHFVIEKLNGIDGKIVRIHPNKLTNYFCKALKNAGLPHFRFHDLRHYSASIMHAMGIPDQYIMERGGWKTDRVLKEVYRNVIEDEQKKFTKKINDHFEEMGKDL